MQLTSIRWDNTDTDIELIRLMIMRLLVSIGGRLTIYRNRALPKIIQYYRLSCSLLGLLAQKSRRNY